MDAGGTLRPPKNKEIVRIPLNTAASFEEVLLTDSSLTDDGEPRTVDVWTRLLVSGVTDALNVELVEPSDDESRSRHDLQRYDEIVFIAVFQVGIRLTIEGLAALCADNCLCLLAITPKLI